MNNTLKKLVDAIERGAAELVTDHPGPSYISLAPSTQSTDGLQVIPDALLFTCIFFAQEKHSQFVEALQEILQRHCSFGVTQGHATAFAALAKNVEAGAEAETLKLDLIIYPSGIIWSYSPGATIIWSKGQWFAFTPRFEKANGPLRAHFASQHAYKNLPEMMRDTCV